MKTRAGLWIARLVVLALVFGCVGAGVASADDEPDAAPRDAPRPPKPGDAARGAALLTKKGCLTCHSTDGSRRSGPSLLGLYGTKRSVVSAGSTREVTADDAYLTRALEDPDADVVVGYPRGMMPKFGLPNEDVLSIARAIEQMPAPPPSSRGDGARSPTAMAWLAISSALFVGLHLLLSSIAVRKKLIKTVGAGGFAGLYSLMAGVTLVGMVLAFRAAPYVEVWVPARALRWAPVLAMPVAILFMVAGFSTKSATAVGQQGALEEERPARGILSVTRHPALWGFTIWATAHLATNGELRAIIVFVAILTLALLGMLHIDRRRAAELGDAWKTYEAQTSLVPFGAILGKRATFDVRGIGIARVLISAFLYVAVLHTHALLIGASPMP